MSEPVTNAEIEDVLSSIRRLVSEDSRNAIRQKDVEPEQQPVDRLVLTPSLRVAGDEPDVTPEAEDVVETDQFDALPEADDSALSDWAEEQEEAVAEEVEDAIVEAPWTDPEATLYEAVGDPQHEAEAEPEHEDWDDGDSAEDAQAAEEEWVQEEAEAAEDEWTPEEAEHAEDSVEELTAEWQDDAQYEDAAEDEESDEGEAEDPGLAGAVEALSAVMEGAESDDWEPHGDETADIEVPETEPMQWRDDVQAAPEPEFIEMTPAASGDDGPDLLPEDETILDEATLRELVTDIVREELQGALGERITRNVRKLVRREINRALSVQDLE